MVRGSAIGIGKGLGGREAARMAMQRALDRLGTSRPCLAVAFISQEFDVSEVLTGLMSYLGNVPVWGFSTTTPFTDQGEHPRTVVVALLSGVEMKAPVYWWPNYAQDSTATALQMEKVLIEETRAVNGILIAADGVNGNLGPVENILARSNFPIAGCLASGNYQQNKTHLIGGTQSGEGALASVHLSGRFSLGSAAGNVWKPLGIQFQVTKTRNMSIQSLDDRSPSDVYEQVFGYPAADWALSPLSELVRLYPLGVESAQSPGTFALHAPLRMEMDGSLRMNTMIPSGQKIRLMTGDPDGCISKAKQVAQEALQNLQNARPMLGIVMVDLAWQFLLQNRFSEMIQEIKQIFGEVPIIGAFTLGQITQSKGDISPQLVNQNLLIAALGERERQ
jgi:hypothetical protein